MQLTTVSNNVDSKNKRKRKLQRQPNRKRRLSQHRSSNMILGASWIWTPTMTNLRTIISNQTKKIHFALNRERASMARKAAMDIINQGMEVSIGASNNQCIILSKFHLINISRASLMSLDGRAMMTCGDMRQDFNTKRQHSNNCIIRQKRGGTNFWISTSAARLTYTLDGGSLHSKFSVPSVDFKGITWKPKPFSAPSNIVRGKLNIYKANKGGSTHCAMQTVGRKKRGGLCQFFCWIRRGIFSQWRGAMYITTRITKRASMLYLFQNGHLNDLPIP